MDYLSQVLTVAAKDLAIEWRSWERTLSVGAFAALTVLLFAMASEGAGANTSVLAAPVTWMTLIFGGLLSVARTYHLEKEDEALLGVLQSPAHRDAIYLGKTLANTVIVFPVAFLVLAACTVLFDLEMPRFPALAASVAVLGLGSVGFVALGTLLAVISTGARSGDALLLILVLPLAVPVVVFGVDAFDKLLTGRPAADALPQVRWLGAFALVALFGGAVLFRHLIEE